MTRGGAGRSHRPMRTQNRRRGRGQPGKMAPPCGRAQSGADEGRWRCPSSPRSDATQLSPSRAAAALLAPGVSVCEPASLRAGFLRRRLGFRVPSVSPGWPESPLIFIVRFCGNSSPRDWTSGLGCPCVGATAPRSFRGGLCSRILPAGAQPPMRGCGASLRRISAPPVGLHMAFPLYPQMYVLRSARVQVILHLVCIIIWL